MERYFNTTGVCINLKHYMVNIDGKLKKIEKLIDRGSYLTINKPRQFGKTTTLALLKKRLKEKYIVINCSFEGIGESTFLDEGKFAKEFISLMAISLENTYYDYSKELYKSINEVVDLTSLSKAITKLVKGCNKEVILFIDEVDKSSDNQLFLSFLGMLRNKYLMREMDEDFTFKSVVLAGVYDVKSLKLKLRNSDEIKYNSPWNIAVNFSVDMSFDVEEILTMIDDYTSTNNINMNNRDISERIYYFTNGYPFLVSRICNIIDEDIYMDSKVAWNIDDIDKSVKIILSEQNTLFDSLIKNLENNEDLYSYIKDIIIGGATKTFNIDNPLVNLGVTFGYFKNNDGKIEIANQIFLERIYNYMVSKMENKSNNMDKYNFKNNFITEDNGLDIEQVLNKFKQYMKENYSSVDEAFIEREGRLIFLAFIAPIINGVGFALKEVQISEEKRLDVVITYNNLKYIIELKVWRGEVYHQKGIKQLSYYLDIHGMDKGYLVIFNFNKNKEYKEEKIKADNKDIFSVYV